MQPPSSLVSYEVDAADLIVAVGGDWDAFALANEAPELAHGAVLGRSLWEFVAGIQPRHIFGHLLTAARGRPQPVVVTANCDSPALRRCLRLTLAGRPAGSVRVESVVVAEEPRAPLDLLARTAKRDRNLITMCSWCNSVRLPQGEWVTIERAVDELRLLRDPHYPALTHGICAACESRLAGGLDLD